MLSLKRLQVPVNGRARGRGDLITFISTTTVRGVFTADVKLRAGGGGGGGGYVSARLDGEGGENGDYNNLGVRMVRGSMPVVVGAPAAGGAGAGTGSGSADGDDGNDTTFAGFIANGNRGGKGAPMTTGSRGRIVPALSPPNPDGSNYGRGGLGGSGTSSSGNGNTGQGGAVFLTVKD